MITIIFSVHQILLESENCYSFISYDNSDHDPVVIDFIQWWKSSFLNINVSKIIEMVANVGEMLGIPPLTIKTQPVEVFQSITAP